MALTGKSYVRGARPAIAVQSSIKAAMILAHVKFNIKTHIHHGCKL
jgi:hypothetical protein